MPTMTIENVPEDLYEKLKQSAQEHGRSLNNEAIFCLKRALQCRRVDPEAFLARVANLQKQFSLPPLPRVPPYCEGGRTSLTIAVQLPLLL